MLCWVPVTLDCNGALESGPVTYRHELADITDSGQLPAFTLLVSHGDECIPTVAPPAVGHVQLFRTTAIDAAGNEDCG